MRVVSVIKILTCLTVLFSACSNPKDKDSTEMLDYLDVQISERMKIIDLLPEDSVPEKPDAQALHKRLDEIILISKDVENIGASVSLANNFFKTLSEKYGFSAADLVMLNSGMHVDEIAEHIKQNELSFLNQYILRFTTHAVPLSTAR